MWVGLGAVGEVTLLHTVIQDPDFFCPWPHYPLGPQSHSLKPRERERREWYMGGFY